MTKHYVAYYYSPNRPLPAPVVLSGLRMDPAQEARVNAFIHDKSEAKQLLASFVELPVAQRNRQRWPELEKAMHYCRTHHATLLVVELRNLTNNDRFASLLMHFLEAGEVHCIDQPFIDKTNFRALVEHARQHRRFHGQLIKQGLERTNAKSGNPNAKEVIDRVNRPKIENAVVFALLLKPVIEHYRSKGYSQRRMVNALNHEGIHAPEGGQWVLSQLQKVLDRMRVNDVAIALDTLFTTCHTEETTNETILERVQATNVLPPKGQQWNMSTLEDVLERHQQLIDIAKMNELIVQLAPVFKDVAVSDLTPEWLVEKLMVDTAQSAVAI